MELDADTPHTLAVSDTVLVTREWLRKLAEDMSEIHAQWGAVMQTVKEKGE